MGERSKGFALLAGRGLVGFYGIANGLYRFGLGSPNDIGDYADYLAGIGLAAPQACAYVLAGGMILAGLAMAVGFMHRAAALFFIAQVFVMLWFVHGTSYFGANDYPLAIAALAFTTFAHGPGPFAYQFEVKKNQKG